MKAPSSGTGDVLRRAGKLTAALQIVSVGLLVALIFLYSAITKRQEALRDGVRENAIWAVYQLDREAHELAAGTQIALTGKDRSSNALTRLSQTYGILYSRMDIIEKGRLQDMFADDVEIRQESEAIRDAVNRLDLFFTRLPEAPDALQRLTSVHPSVLTLQKLTGDLLRSANRNVSEQRARSRGDVARMEMALAFFLWLLLLSVGGLVFTLHRQLKIAREAGLGFETVANELASAYHAVDAGNRAKSQFMATMGHEIRTPLNAILGTAELLELKKLPHEVLENVKTIRSSGEALLEILNEILDYSKIEHGKLEVELRPSNVAEIAKAVIGIMHARAAEHSDELVLDMPSSLDRPWVMTDPTRVRQIILNLMSNAIKFTNHGKVTLRVRELSAPNARYRLRIEVQDTGIGIDEEGQKKLFKPFSQVDASISRRYGGTGLGLTISKEIAKRLGGDMGVHSQPGFGSTFWFEIPVERAQAPNVTALQARPAELSRLPRQQILLVEDNKVNQQIALRFLDRLGQTTDLANHGGEAVEAAITKKYDFILMDMQMPVMDGIQATRAIRSSGGPNVRTPIVAMTANASDEDKQACLEAGMDGFESKPISLARLHAILAGGPLGKAVVSRAECEETAVIDPQRKAELVDALGEETFAELVQSFFDDARILVKDIGKAMGEGDREEIDKALHTLKGAAVNIGFRHVADIAQRMRQEPPSDDEFNRLSALIADHEQELLAAA